MATTEVWTYRRVPKGIDLREFVVEAADGAIGTIDEATEQAGENYIVVDTGPWIFGKKVLLPAGVIDRIDAEEAKVFINRSREEIKNAPEYHEELGATEAYRQQVGSYYTAGGIGVSRPESPPPRRRQTSRAQTVEALRAGSQSPTR
jgi:hypothetical protein